MCRGPLWTRRSQRDFPGGRTYKEGVQIGRVGQGVLGDASIEHTYLRYYTMSGAALCVDTALWQRKYLQFPVQCWVSPEPGREFATN
jgi:hypothetical protein